MKKFSFFLICFFLISVFYFGEESKIYLISDFNPSFKNKLIFDLKLEDVYESKLNFDFAILPNKVLFSEVEDIVKYFSFDQAGFEFSYRNPAERNDPYFLINNYNGFTMILDDFLVMTFDEPTFGIVFQEGFLGASFWAKISDISNSRFSLSLSSSNKLGFSLGFYQELEYYFKVGDLLFSLNNKALESVYFFNSEYSLEYHADTGLLIVNSIFFEKNKENFYFRVPINKNLFVTYSNLGLGISLYLNILRNYND